MRLRRTLSVTCLTVTCLTVTGLAIAVAPAQASRGDDAVAEASAGAVRIGETVVAPVAACTTEGQTAGQSGEVAVPDLVMYESGYSTCTLDQAGEVATATVTGGRFRFDGLRQYGGPRLRLTDHVAKCATTRTGSNASVQFSGLSGVTVPADLPSNHVVTIPGGPDGKPMATVTFNEALVPSPPDGSMTVHVMHIRMFPQGGPVSGDAYVGTVRCAPVS